MNITIGTLVTTPEGYTGTVTSEPTFTFCGDMVTVTYAPEFAHHSPVGGADYNTDELTIATR